MKTTSSVTVHIAPLETWGQGSSSYAFAIRGAGFCAVEVYVPGDILVAGTNAKGMIGLVTEVTTQPDGTQEVCIEAVSPRCRIDHLGTRLHEVIPDRFKTGEDYCDFLCTVDGAYQSILDGGDVSVIIPDDAQVSSTEWGELSWQEYRAARQRAVDEARAKKIGEAMRLLSEVIAREEPAFERVWMEAKGAWSPAGQSTIEFARWEYKGIPVMEHDEDDAFLGALVDLLYHPKAAPALPQNA